jgi:hypothetical protein
VPPVLTSIPSFVLAVKVFKFYDKLPSVIFPYLAGVLSIFLMRQAFKGVPDDLIDAGRIDGASEVASGGASCRLSSVHHSPRSPSLPSSSSGTISSGLRSCCTRVRT